MKKTYHTAIIGGGAAGLMTAVDLLRCPNSIDGADVIILEKNDRVGKKLIATGNGQGNLTNENFSVNNYYGDKAFIESFVADAKSINIKNYLEEIGIPLCTGKDGKVYPLSKQASAVLDVIRLNLLSQGVTEKTTFEVTSIDIKGENYLIRSKDETITAKNVVVAVGGAAAKQFGTDGSQYKILERLGHRKTALYPSLVQLKTDTELIRGLKGLKEVARVTAIVNGKEIKSVTGDLLFTEFGVSGSAIFELSAVVTDKTGVKLKIEFIPELTSDEIRQIIEKRKGLKYFSDADLMTGLVNKRIGQAVLKTVGERSSSKIAFALKNFTLSVTGNLGFNYAQVTKGGIETKDVYPKTMESKLFPNLYIVGEVLDVDGDCGGYNLTFAFVSAILASRAIKNK